jgi:hypothetical protein
MAEPLRITRSLDDITTRYTVFEPNQVLTHDQLNDLAGYLDDQDRLTRVGLLGVGIICGLRVSLSDTSVTVTRGVGVTTDGDLLRLPADIRFDHFRPYDKSAPAYAPFYVDQDVAKDMLPVFELVSEASATPLDQLTAQTGIKLGDMAAVLLMESYVQDGDLCTATDCDNLGQGSIHTPKLLLLRKSDLAALQEKIPTLDQAGRSLHGVVLAERAFPNGNAATEDALAAAYRIHCTRLHIQIVRALQTGASVLADLTGDDTAPWIGTLEALRTRFTDTSAGIQYYYDFLKDLAETWNAFLELFSGDVTVCCPDLAAFPKHLMLGGLQGDAAAELRTGFYPSPLASRTAGHREHARFLGAKLGALISLFELPAGVQVIRVTPSNCEDRNLEERAIPYYYKPPIHRSWNYALEQRGASAQNYSYNARLFGATYAALNPLIALIGRFDFFRIEGHLGQDVARAIKFLEAEIRSKNLPIQVRAVALSEDRTKVTVKPPVRYSDLHRFHYVLRQDLVTQLADTKSFSEAFKKQVDVAVATNVVTDQADDNDSASVSTIAQQKHTAVIGGSTAASAKLNRSYAEYVKDTSWKSDIASTQTAAGEFKANLGKVVKTEFSTPFDSLITSNQTLWLGWLDDMIQTKSDQEDDKLLFAKFLALHPGLEHFAGVTRGGTFVLVYDTSNTVVADFMLPYICCDPVEEAPPEPPLPRPVVKPKFVVEQGVKVLPSREKLIKEKLTGFRAEIEPEWKKDLQIQTDYVNVFKDSVKLMGTMYTANPKAAVGPKVADPLLDIHLREMDVQREKVDYLLAEKLKPSADPERQKTIDSQLNDAELALATAAGDTTQYVATAKLDVKEGGDGLAAMTVVSEHIGRLVSKDAQEQVRKGFTAASAKATPELRGTFGNVLKTRGLG